MIANPPFNEDVFNLIVFINTINYGCVFYFTKIKMED